MVQVAVAHILLLLQVVQVILLLQVLLKEMLAEVAVVLHLKHQVMERLAVAVQEQLALMAHPLLVAPVVRA